MGIPKLNFLLIDDDEVFNYLNKKSVTKSEHSKDVEIFLSAANALEYLHELIKSKKEFPDIILLDISMPVMNGFDFLEAFEKLPAKFKTKTSIYMLSSSMNDEDVKSAGNFTSVIGYLCKPLNLKKVDEICNEVLSLKKTKKKNINTKENSNEIYTIPMERKTGLANL